MQSDFLSSYSLSGPAVPTQLAAARPNHRSVRDQDTATGSATSESRLSEEFTRFYRDALPSVYSYLANRCGSGAIAEDLVHDCFVAALNAMKNGSEVTVPWVMRVARNKLVDHYRRDRVRRAQSTLERGRVPDEVVAWQGESSRDVALQVLAGLSGDHRVVLVLRHMDGLRLAEIAALMRRSVHATESLLMRAKADFKRRYEEVTSVE